MRPGFVCGKGKRFGRHQPLGMLAAPSSYRVKLHVLCLLHLGQELLKRSNIAGLANVVEDAAQGGRITLAGPPHRPQRKQGRQSESPPAPSLLQEIK